MARRVFLHIGAPKTGTTFLQTVMWHNKSVLADQGMLYPGAKRMDHYHASRVVRGVPATRLGQDAGSWDLLVEELAAWPYDGLVSHEFFSMATASQARAAVERLAPAEVHVVLTARDYVRQFPAVWQEALKMNSDLSLDEFMDRALRFDLSGAWGWSSQDIVAVLDRWSGAVVAEHVHLVTVPRPGAPRDLLWQRWCEVLGLDAATFDLDVAFGNESLGAAQVALLHRVKPYLSGPLGTGPERHRWFRQYFGHEVLVPQAGERFGLRTQQAEKLRELSEAAVKVIETAGYHVTGDLAELVPDLDERASPHPDDIPDAVLVDVAARAIEQMIGDVRALTLERNRWRRRAKNTSAVRRGAGRARRLAGRISRRTP
jgi:hypothetical protein